MNMTTVPSNQLKAMQHEIASLKEQVALYAGIDDEKACIAHLLDRANETIAQQAEAIRVKDESLFAACSTFAEYAQIHANKSPPDIQKIEFNAERANQMNVALAIQPSPEHLEAWYKGQVGDAVAYQEYTEDGKSYYLVYSKQATKKQTPLHAIKPFPFKGE